jgi:hypothetical protein
MHRNEATEDELPLLKHVAKRQGYTYITIQRLSQRPFDLHVKGLLPLPFAQRLAKLNRAPDPTRTPFAGWFPFLAVRALPAGRGADVRENSHATIWDLFEREVLGHENLEGKLNKRVAQP